MPITIGKIKASLAKKLFDNVELQFEFDEYGSIKEGKIVNVNDFVIANNIFFKENLYFSNETFSINLRVNKLVFDDLSFHFKTITFLCRSIFSYDNILTFYCTRTSLMFGHQNIRIDDVIFGCTNYMDFGAIEFLISKELNIKDFYKCKKIVLIVLTYYKIIQLKHCMCYGYKCGNFLFINYTLNDKEEFRHSYAIHPTINQIEEFYNLFIQNAHKEHLVTILNRLITAKNSNVNSQKFVWIIFTLEALTKLYNKVNHTSKSYAQLIDENDFENKIIKVAFTKQSRIHWKPLLWIYRDKLAHYISSIEEMEPKPNANQEEKLNFVMKEDFDKLYEEYKKYVPIAQNIWCKIFGINYIDNFPKLYEERS